MTLLGETSLASGPSYETVDREEETRLVSELIDSTPELAASNSEFALATLSGDSPYANLARSLECRVFNAYFQNNPSVMAEEYWPYEQNSIFFLLMNRENKEAAGVMRLILPNENGLKCANDIASGKCLKPDTQEHATDLTSNEIYAAFGIEPSTAVEMATVAAEPKYGEKATGSPIVLASLMRALYMFSQERIHDGVNLLAIIDAVPRSKLESYGLPIHDIEAIANPFTYLGAEGNSYINIPVGEVQESVSAKNQVVFDYTFGSGALFGQTELSSTLK